jgi:hypothetical protein
MVFEGLTPFVADCSPHLKSLIKMSVAGKSLNEQAEA